jgi:hypothetical protein
VQLVGRKPKNITFQLKSYQSHIPGRVQAAAVEDEEEDGVPSTCGKRGKGKDSGKAAGAERRFQVHVDGLLTELSDIRNGHTLALATHHPKKGGGGRGGGGVVSIKEGSCVVGITLQDLYSGNSDLFVAGMAAGGSKVAVLSFARYHPRIKMSPFHWHDYGYISRDSSYPYLEDNRARPVGMTAQPFHPVQTQTQTAQQEKGKGKGRRGEGVGGGGSEYFRRAGKLLMHELCHVFGLDHCIFYHCLMNGTGGWVD